MSNNPFVSSTQGSVVAAPASRWITNPKHLSLFVPQQSRLSVKTAQTSASDASAAGFFTALALRGASTSISVAATYATVCNLTGAGFLFNAVSPTHSASFTPTFRITVDGTAYVIAPSAAQIAGNRMVLGPLTPGISSAAGASAPINSDLIIINGPNDAGIAAGLTGGIAVGTNISYVGIPTPEMILSYGLQCLRFEQSLKVEMMCDLLSGTAVDKQCGATYRLDL